MFEANMDGIVGPTHHFGGLGVGNIASKSHEGMIAHPQAAAIQGIEKMRLAASLGAYQVILPPQWRPLLETAEQLGFQGTEAEQLSAIATEDARLLSAIWSSSAMWTANAATVSSAPACRAHKTHLTIANLCSSLHRSLEPTQTYSLFKRIFRHDSFVVHAPLPSSLTLRDEGAANHMRLSDCTGQRCIDLFVYGAETLDQSGGQRFFPRQSLAACQAIARRHGLDPRSTFYLRQHPRAIDSGAFHNDVVAMSHQHIWVHHELAYEEDAAVFQAIADRFEEVTGEKLFRYEVPNQQLSLEDAVSCYLFNSQLITDSKSHAISLIAPQQVSVVDGARQVLEELSGAHGVIQGFFFVDLRESMSNGGGPACLRLRVPMSESQWASLPLGIRFTSSLADRLCETIEETYPKSVRISDLGTADLVQVAARAVAAIRTCLGFESQDFVRDGR